MIAKRIAILLLMIFGYQLLCFSQCGCTNCPLPTDDSGIVTSTINISGSSNSVLGTNGQYLKSVHLSIESLEIGEFEIRLYAPSGDFVTLSTSNNPGNTPTFFFDICFVSCDQTALPDDGFIDFFDSSAQYLPNVNYTGSYYPVQSLGPPYNSLGCLETLTGAVDGDWQLWIEDQWPTGITSNATILDWSLEFADNSGTSCTSNTCAVGTPLCDLSTYQLVVPLPQVYCQGDAGLDFTINPTYNGDPPEPQLYGYKYYVVDANTNIILEITDVEPDMTSYPAGDYELCVVQFLLTDEALLPVVGESYGNILVDIANGVYCAFISCSVVGIIPDFATPQISWPIELCAGQLYDFPIENFDPTVTYFLSISSGSFGQFTFDNATGIITLLPNSGPINICVEIQNDCDNVPNCASIPVVVGNEQPILDSPFGVCLNTSFQVDVLNDPLAETYTWTISGPGVIDIDNNNSIDVSSTGVGTITICAVASSSNCGTSPEECADIIVSDPAPPTILADPVYCIPDGFLVGNSNGGATSTVYTQLSGPGTITFFNPNVVTTAFTVDLPGTYTIQLTKTVNGCEVSTTATFEVVEGLVEPILNAPSEVCFDESFTVSDTNTPPAQQYNWTVSGPGTISENNNSSVEITPSSAGLIEVCATTSSTECGTSAEICVTIDVLDPEAPQITAASPVCIPGDFVIGTPNGSANPLNWQQVSGPGTLVFNAPSEASTAYTVDLPGIYVIEFSEDNNGCIRTTSQVIEVLPELEVTGEVNCVGNQFQVSLTFLNGLAPYAVFNNPVSGNTYTSELYPSGSAVLFTYTDANGCEGQFFVQEFCTCTTDAGTMDQTLIEFCDITQTAQGIDNNDSTFDSNDVGIYILHTSPTNSLGTVLQESNSGLFSFAPPMVLGETYYISYVVGDPLNGSVDLDDPCLSVSIGQPVIWQEEISAEIQITEDLDECDNQLTLTALLSQSSISNLLNNWTVISSPSGATVVFSTPNQLNTDVEFDTPGDYVIEYIGAGNSCSFSAEIEVTIYEPLEISEPIIECSPDGSTYQVTVTINQGNEPYAINGMSISGDTFISSSIPSGSPYSFVIADNSPCPSETIQGTFNCDCTSDSGFMLDAIIELCAPEQAIAQHNNDEFLDSNDDFLFVLHDNPSTSLGNIIAENQTGIFDFPNNITLGQTYYISFIVGNELGTGIDYDDPCLSVSIGQPVIWYETPAATINSDFESCEGVFDVVIENALESTIIWTILNAPAGSNPQLNTSIPEEIQLTADIPGLYTLESTLINGICEQVLTVNLTLNEGIIVEEIEEICDGLVYEVSFTIQSGSGPFEIDGEQISGNNFVSEPISSGENYSFEVIDNNGCTIVVAGSKNCDCESNAGVMSDAIVSVCDTSQVITISFPTDTLFGNNDVGGFFLHDGENDILGNVFSQNATGVFNYQEPLVPSVIYYVSFVIGDEIAGGNINLNDPCLDVSVGTPVQWNLPLQSQLANEISNCEKNLMIPNSDIIGNSDTIVWSLLESPANSSLEIEYSDDDANFEFDSTGTYIFEYTFSYLSCEYKDTLQIEILPEIELENVQIICSPDNTTYEVSFVVVGGEGPYLVNGIELADNYFSSGPIAAGDGYSWFVDDFGPCSNISLQGVQDCSCPNSSGDLSDIAIELCEGGNLNINYESTPLNIDEYQDFLVLHDGTSGTIGEILQEIENQELVFDLDIPLNQQLWITPISAPLLSDGQIDFSDPCLQIGISTPVTWESNTLLNMETDKQLLCEGDFITITLQFIGQQYPILAELQGPGISEIIQFNSGAPMNIVVVADSSGFFTLNPIDINCLDASSILSIEVEVEDCSCISYTFNPVDSICVTEASIDLSTWINETTNGNWDIINSTSSIPPSLNSSDNLDISEVTTGSTTLSFESSDPESCDSTYLFEIYLESSYDAEVDISYQLYCHDEVQNIQLIDFITGALPPGYWTEEFENQVSQLASSEINLQFKEPGLYNYSYVSEQPNILCPELEINIAIEIAIPLTYQINIENPLCTDELGSINIDFGNQDNLVTSVLIEGDELNFPYDLDLDPGTYQIELLDLNGCSYQDLIAIESPVDLELSLEATSDPSDDNNYTVIADAIGNTDGLSYQWFVNGQLVSPTDELLTVVITENTIISLFASNSDGCTAEAEVNLIHRFEESIDIILPNMLVPNSLSGNDLFVIPPYKAIAEVNSFRIYDRWGNRVFSAQNYDPRIDIVGWDGSQNGRPCVQGVYGYFIEYIDSDGNTKTLIGNITLIR